MSGQTRIAEGGQRSSPTNETRGRAKMAQKGWSDFNPGDRVMACHNLRDIGTVREVSPGSDVAGRAFVQWDNDGSASWLRADLLAPSPHVEDEAWEWLLDLLLEGEIDTAEFRRQATASGYAVMQINNAIDFNYDEIRSMMPREERCERCDDSGWIVVRNHYPMSYVGPGPAPDYARNVTDAKCDECHGANVIKAHMALDSADTALASLNDHSVSEDRS